MHALNPADFTREEIRKRIIRHASAVWQMRVKDVEAADPLVAYLLEACSYELENTAKAIEATRQRIIDRLASVMCPDVIDLPRPAHAILHSRPEAPVLDLSQTTQFFYRQPIRNDNRNVRELHFTPAVTSRLVNGDIRYLLSEQGLVQFSGPDRLPLIRQIEPTHFTDHQSIWLGIELNQYVTSLAGLTVYFNWENESETKKASYYRKLQDTTQTRWWLNGRELPVHVGFVSPETNQPKLDVELDALHQLEQEVMNLYDRCFITLGDVPDVEELDYDRRPFPPGFQFTDRQRQQYFQHNLVWLEIRIGRDFPPAAIATMEVRLNCFPVMNRYMHQVAQRLYRSLNVFPLKSETEFLFIRRVYDAESKNRYRSSPLRDVDQLEENSFMWRPHGVGRFDDRNALELLEYVQQLILEENRAFSALGTGWFTQTIDNLAKSLEELRQQLKAMPGEGFKVGHPYIFVKPREGDTNIYIEFWSTDGKLANHIPASTRLKHYGGYDSMRNEEDLYLVTMSVGGRDKPSTTEKEYQLRQTLLTRQRLVTMADIEVECQAYFYGRLGGVPVSVRVEKRFAEGLIEGAGYVRCLDVLITPKGHTDLTPTEWDAECERCRQHLADRSAMNLPYRVRYNPRTL